RGYPPEGRDRLLPGDPTPPGSARAWPADAYQRPHPEGPEADRRRKEEARPEVIRSAETYASEGSYRDRRQEGAAQGTEERRPRARAHQEHLQQHHRVDHRPERCCHLLVLRGPGGLQGLPQVDT